MSDEKKSFLETVREVDRKEREEAEAREREKEEQRAKREEEAKRAYANRVQQEKIQLMKLKQGVITEDEIEKEVVVERKYSIWEKIGNFFYHNGWWLIILVIGLIFATIMIVDIATKERPDIQILYINGDLNMQYNMDKAEEILAPYCPDYNGDGEVCVAMYYMPANYEDENNTTMELVSQDRTKLFGEFQDCRSLIIIGDEENYESLGILDDVFVDMRELFPNDENATEIGYKLSATNFAEQLGYSELPDDLYISIRKPRDLMGTSEEKFQQNYERAVALVTSFINDNATKSH